MLWIKEVEMIESVDDLKSSRSITRIHGPNFELLDARITLQENAQSAGNDSSKRRPLSPRKTDSLPDLRILPGH